MPRSEGNISIAGIERTFDLNASAVAMQSQLRQAVFDAISEDDVAAIVKKQVEKAKKGDDKSLQFVMRYVLGVGQPVTLQQVNVMDVETAAKIADGNRRR